MPHFNTSEIASFRNIVLTLFGFCFIACAQQPTPTVPPTVTPTATLLPTATATALPSPTETPEPTATPAFTARFESAECQFYTLLGERVSCGYLVVPEDRANPERTIRLHIAIIASRSDSPAPDPVVYLDGGPGGQTLFATDNYARAFADILATHDLILFDQRGVGFSEPSLDCPELFELLVETIELDIPPAELQQMEVDAVAACHQRLVAEGINLSAYTSAASAADLDDLRKVLGYNSWNLLGISYGTRLGLTALRDYGETGTIRSVILDSVYPPQVDTQFASGQSIDRAFDLLFSRCATDEECNDAYPDLEKRFYELVDLLNQDPITLTVRDNIESKSYQVQFNGYALLNTYFEMMYVPEQIVYMPRMISRLEQGRTTALATWLTNGLFRSRFASEGMGISVSCTEELPFMDWAEVEAINAALPPTLGFSASITADQLQSVCDVWRVEPTDALENEPVASDVPVLILAGDYDPITPPSYGMDSAEYLPNSYYFELVGKSHAVTLNSRCALDLTTQFLLHPDDAPDASCVEDLFFGFSTMP